jgi:hypothetical protein
MKPASFDSTPEFANYKDVMRKFIAVPKAEVDELIRKAKEASSRNRNPDAPGRKSVKRKRSRR